MYFIDIEVVVTCKENVIFESPSKRIILFVRIFTNKTPQFCGELECQQWIY
jgi:hypothetical protein